MTQQKMKEHLRTLISAEQIKARTQEVAGEIMDGFRGDEMVVIGLLDGSFVFLADLVRALHTRRISIRIDFMTVSSYGSGTQSSGNVNIQRDIRNDVRGCHVLLVDDIVDTGHTLYAVAGLLREKKPASLKTCVLLDKPERRILPPQVDYIGFEVPNEFVVGYGLDYAGRYRELPYIAALSFSGGDE